MVQYYWVLRRNGSVHLVAGNWFMEPIPGSHVTLAWPTNATAEGRWRLARLRSAPGPDWELIEVAILTSTDTYEDPDAGAAALQNANEAGVNLLGDNMRGEGAAPSGGRSVERADSGFGGSSNLDDSDNDVDHADEPPAKRRRRSTESSESKDKGESVNPPAQNELQSDGRTNATAELRLSVRTAPNNQAPHSDLLANLLFKLPAHTHDAVTSEVVLEIFSEDARVVVNGHDGGRQIINRSCSVSWAKDVPRRCVDDPKLRAVIRGILSGTRCLKRKEAPSASTRSRSNSV
ncbi:hypothetical protein QAD02_021484 [Eretmocerus hayati]|uniref:Uncharacterized protein n=1 Tax=Eretmocerus hayati TaxID=131215 RepID=A0ACC2PSA3_9HYME|nr:hypothetical protein QAD02_021484 [Eretmocerus hayati]